MELVPTVEASNSRSYFKIFQAKTALIAFLGFRKIRLVLEILQDTHLHQFFKLGLQDKPAQRIVRLPPRLDMAIVDHNRQT